MTVFTSTEYEGKKALQQTKRAIPAENCGQEKVVIIEEKTAHEQADPQEH